MRIKDIVARQATVDDVDELAMLLSELFVIEKDFDFDFERHRKALLMMMDNETAVIWVAEIGERIAGMVTGQLVISTASGGFSVLLEDMCITKEERRIGIGTVLMRHIELWAKRKGALRIQLVADENNIPALSFYYSHGFSMSNMKGLYKYGAKYVRDV